MSSAYSDPATDVVVVIPAYRPVPTADEARALVNAGRVLARYPRVLMIPDTLDPAPYLALLPDLAVERFAPEFFQGVLGYNRLMLDDGFYARFAKWRYLLLHQLDAWVFADRLMAWCARDYDYVGAPWLRRWQLGSGLGYAYRELRRRLCWHLPIDPRSRWARYRLPGRSGNGGLSLRRVAAFRAVLARPPRELALFRQARLKSRLNEDVFWSVWAGLTMPEWHEGLTFAVEDEVTGALALLDELPFGCHAWPVFADAWRRVPAAQGMFAAPVS